MPSRPSPLAGVVASAVGAALALTGVATTSGSAYAAPTAGTIAGPTAATGAADPTPGYSVTSISVPVTVAAGAGSADDQTCTVDADLYRPDHVGSSKPAPAILTTHGFGGSKADDNQLATAKGFVGQGYVVLSYSGLGFGSTTCRISLDDPDLDGRAGSQLVDVLAGTRSFTLAGGKRSSIHYVAQNRPGDPRVGMIGGSYGGQIQYAVASRDPRVDALIPIITWNDLSYSLAPNNTSTAPGSVTYATPGVAKKEWTNLFFADGIVSGVQGASASGDVDTLPGCPNFVQEACPAILGLDTLGYPDAATLALSRHASVSSYVAKVRAPTLVVQGEQDTLFNLQEAVATYRSLKAQGTPTRMVWQSWGHSHSEPAPGELDLGADSIRDTLLGRRFVDWMDHYVRGDGSAPVGPHFAYFRDWVDYDTSPAHAGTAVSKAYARAGDYSGEPTARLYLSGNDALVGSAASVASGSASYANVGPVPTSYSETSGLEGNQVDLPPTDAPGTFAAWTSPALAAPADLVGSARLTVNLDAPVAAATQSQGPGGQLVLFAKLYDVAPDGSKVLENRLISPVRVGDVTRPVQITLPGVVQRFPTGHRIQLVLAASDAAYAGNAAPQPVTVTTSKDAPGTLGLPLTSALRFAP